MRTIRFTVKPLNAERKLNALHSRGIQTYDIEKGEHSLSFSVDKKHEQQVKEILQHESNDMQTKTIGLESFLQFMRNRIGLIVGLCISFLLILIFSNVLLVYDIKGLNRVEKSEIIDLLKENGYNIGSLSFSLNVEDIEPLILSHFPDISFASALVVGNTLVLHIKEKDYDEETDTTLFSPIYAEFTGVISEMKVQQGTPLVKVGDIVKKGQMLIAPYVLDGDKSIPVQAKGEVYARTYIKGQVVYDTNKPLQGRTGNVYIKRTMNILGMNVPCSQQGDESILQSTYEVETITQTMNGIVPIIMQDTIYYEIGDIGEANYERDRVALEKESLYKAYENIKSNFEIVSQNTQTIEIDGVYHITTYLEVRKNIATKEQL